MGNKIKLGMLKAMPQKWDVAENWAIFEKQFETHGKDVDVFITPGMFPGWIRGHREKLDRRALRRSSPGRRAKRVHPTGMRDGTRIAHPYCLWIHRKTRGIFLQCRYIGESHGKNCRDILQNAFAIARSPFCARR